MLAPATESATSPVIASRNIRNFQFKSQEERLAWILMFSHQSRGKVFLSMLTALPGIQSALNVASRGRLRAPKPPPAQEWTRLPLPSPSPDAAPAVAEQRYEDQ